MNIDSIKGKAHPSFGMIYNSGTQEWQVLSALSGKTGNTMTDFKGAPCPQKAAASYLFLFDEGIDDWRPMAKADTASAFRTNIVNIPTGSSFTQISGLGFSATPSFLNTSVIRPSQGATLIYGSIRGDSITSGGFIVDYSNTITGSGYMLSYMVKE